MDFEDPVRKYVREANELEASRERERRAMQREHRAEQRQRERDRAAVEIAELRAEIAELRLAISEGDADVINTVNDAVFPALEKICDGLKRKINEIGERVDRRLSEMQTEVRAGLKRERGEVFELPSLREARKIN